MGAASDQDMAELPVSQIGVQHLIDLLVGKRLLWAVQIAEPAALSLAPHGAAAVGEHTQPVGVEIGDLTVAVAAAGEGAGPGVLLLQDHRQQRAAKQRQQTGTVLLPPQRQGTELIPKIPAGGGDPHMVPQQHGDGLEFLPIGPAFTGDPLPHLRRNRKPPAQQQQLQPQHPVIGFHVAGRFREGHIGVEPHRILEGNTAEGPVKHQLEQIGVWVQGAVPAKSVVPYLHLPGGRFLCPAMVVPPQMLRPVRAVFVNVKAALRRFRPIPDRVPGGKGLQMVLVYAGETLALQAAVEQYGGGLEPGIDLHKVALVLGQQQIDAADAVIPQLPQLPPHRHGHLPRQCLLLGLQLGKHGKVRALVVHGAVLMVYDLYRRRQQQHLVLVDDRVKIHRYALLLVDRHTVGLLRL